MVERSQEEQNLHVYQHKAQGALELIENGEIKKAFKSVNSLLQKSKGDLDWIIYSAVKTLCLGLMSRSEEAESLHKDISIKIIEKNFTEESLFLLLSHILKLRDKEESLIPILEELSTKNKKSKQKFESISTLLVKEYCKFNKFFELKKISQEIEDIVGVPKGDREKFSVCQIAALYFMGKEGNGGMGKFGIMLSKGLFAKEGYEPTFTVVKLYIKLLLFDKQYEEALVLIDKYETLFQFPHEAKTLQIDILHKMGNIHNSLSTICLILNSNYASESNYYPLFEINQKYVIAVIEILQQRGFNFREYKTDNFIAMWKSLFEEGAEKVENIIEERKEEEIKVEDNKIPGPTTPEELEVPPKETPENIEETKEKNKEVDGIITEDSGKFEGLPLESCEQSILSEYLDNALRRLVGLQYLVSQSPKSSEECNPTNKSNRIKSVVLTSLYMLHRLHLAGSESPEYDECSKQEKHTPFLPLISFYIKKYFHHPSTLDEIWVYLAYLNSPSREQLYKEVSSLIVDNPNNNNITTETEWKKQSLHYAALCTIYKLEYILESRSIHKISDLMKYISDLFTIYRESLCIEKQPEKGERRSCDDLILLISAVTENYTQRELVKENPMLGSTPNTLQLIILIIINYTLKYSPHNFDLAIQSAKLSMKLNLDALTTFNYNKLSMKGVMLETMAYEFYKYYFYSGNHILFITEYAKYEKFFKRNKEDLKELKFKALKHGEYEEFGEFMDYEKLYANSQMEHVFLVCNLESMVEEGGGNANKSIITLSREQILGQIQIIREYQSLMNSHFPPSSHQDIKVWSGRLRVCEHIRKYRLIIPTHEVDPHVLWSMYHNDPLLSLQHFPTRTNFKPGIKNIFGVYQHPSIIQLQYNLYSCIVYIWDREYPKAKDCVVQIRCMMEVLEGEMYIGREYADFQLMINTKLNMIRVSLMLFEVLFLLFDHELSDILRDEKETLKLLQIMQNKFINMSMCVLYIYILYIYIYILYIYMCRRRPRDNNRAE